MLKPAKSDKVESIDVTADKKSPKKGGKKTPALDKYRMKKGC